ncbi:four-carbon acid sugar kinase family protein [Vibrio fluvialis]|uniref:3-oxo-tetronate kinase n=1 Tax=Vibrio fluvialis TaxID=676 RepID=UPI00215CAFAF|nr:3-oxo-tetronate kinase [Vibrio fluvialis]MCR9300040.1 four-carbon acid sugar kinase family protein [Vibrio fluvialis]
MLLGVIADDFTGATDIAGFLVENGMRTVQLNGMPAGDTQVDADAVVISLKSRSCPANQAVSQSLAALRWLQAQGCQQFYFKYCSTFDSTEQGNIGPVTDALLAELNETFTIVCPALPVNGRTVFNGHLFVLGEPLNESGMRHHPVTPMSDSSVVRLMNRQSQGECGLVNYQVIEQGADAVVARFAELQSEGKRYAVVDAINSAHLVTLGQAAKSLKLITGGSGLAAGIAQNWADTLADQSEAKSAGLPQRAPSVVLSGSCSLMTNQQVARYQTLAPHFAVDVEACLRDEQYVQHVFDWVTKQLDGDYAPMVYATADAEQLKAIQAQYGAAASSEAVEQFFSQLAHQLQEFGVQNFIVAGGETSGTVTQSLGVTGFHIGPQIAPGVPWVKSIDGSLSLALKSGNFGDERFFEKAQDFYL